jgi:hypothetical protein
MAQPAHLVHTTIRAEETGERCTALPPRPFISAGEFADVLGGLDGDGGGADDLTG